MAKIYSCTSYLSLVILIIMPLVSEADVCSQGICSCWTVAPGTMNYNCEGKRLTDIPRPLSKAATTLSVAANKITTIPRRSFATTTAITMLNFYDNQISTIENGAFDKLMRLKELILKNNKLTSIYHEMFRHLAALEYLDLSNNRIIDLHRYAFFSLPSITTVEMANNSLHCGCEERLIREFLELAPNPRFIKNAICTNLGDAPLMGLPYSAFPQCNPDDYLFPPSRSRYCHACSAVSSVQKCGEQPQSQCINQNVSTFVHHIWDRLITVRSINVTYVNCTV